MKLSDLVSRKFEDICEIPEGFKIKGPNGFVPISNIMKTVEYTEWKVTLDDGKSFTSADDHIVFYADGSEVFVKNLKIGESIITEDGISSVTKLEELDMKSNMFDIQVDSDDHSYYANGVLHHNTTVAAAYLLWKAMFRKDSQILIVANKFGQAIEIMDRIKYAYEECPDYIRAGVIEYNKSTITFDNGSKITARATTADAGRGLSITVLYCLSGKEMVTVRDKSTGEIKNISLADLYSELDS